MDPETKPRSGRSREQYDGWAAMASLIHTPKEDVRDVRCMVTVGAAQTANHLPVHTPSGYPVLPEAATPLACSDPGSRVPRHTWWSPRLGTGRTWHAGGVRQVSLVLS